MDIPVYVDGDYLESMKPTLGPLPPNITEAQQKAIFNAADVYALLDTMDCMLVPQPLETRYASATPVIQLGHPVP